MKSHEPDNRSVRSLCAIALLGCCIAAGSAPVAGCANRHNFDIKGDSAADFKKALEYASEGESYRKAGNFAKASELYKKSIAAKGDIGAVWVNYGVCLMELGDFMPARDSFMKAADLLPSDPTPYENLGTLYHNKGYDEKALEYYELSLAKDPHWLPSLRGAVLASKNLKVSTDKGLKHLDDAILIERDPQMLRTMQNERFRVEAALKSKNTAGG